MRGCQTVRCEGLTSVQVQVHVLSPARRCTSLLVRVAVAVCCAFRPLIRAICLRIDVRAPSAGGERRPSFAHLRVPARMRAGVGEASLAWRRVAELQGEGSMGAFFIVPYCVKFEDTMAY